MCNELVRLKYWLRIFVISIVNTLTSCDMFIISYVFTIILKLYVNNGYEMTTYRCIIAKIISICNVGRSALISEYVQKKNHYVKIKGSGW